MAKRKARVEAQDEAQVTHSNPQPPADKSVREIPPLTNIERYQCGNELCGAPLAEGDVFDQPWIDHKNRFRRTRGYQCSACRHAMGCSLYFDDGAGFWRYVIPPRKLETQPAAFIAADMESGGAK